MQFILAFLFISMYSNYFWTTFVDCRQDYLSKICNGNWHHFHSKLLIRWMRYVTIAAANSYGWIRRKCLLTPKNCKITFLNLLTIKLNLYFMIWNNYVKFFFKISDPFSSSRIESGGTDRRTDTQFFCGYHIIHVVW